MTILLLHLRSRRRFMASLATFHLFSKIFPLRLTKLKPRSQFSLLAAEETVLPVSETEKHHCMSIPGVWGKQTQGHAKTRQVRMPRRKIKGHWYLIRKRACEENNEGKTRKEGRRRKEAGAKRGKRWEWLLPLSIHSFCFVLVEMKMCSPWMCRRSLLFFSLLSTGAIRKLEKREQPFRKGEKV